MVSYRKQSCPQTPEIDQNNDFRGIAGMNPHYVFVLETQVDASETRFMPLNIAFTASRAPVAQTARAALIGRYGDVALENADIIVALGGDGFMLQTLHDTQELSAPVYGMNRGTIGFLMNAYSESDLPERLKDAEEAMINPLSMTASLADGTQQKALAINEVSLLRAGPQAAKLRIFVDERLRMDELVCDGALVATPAGFHGL